MKAESFEPIWILSELFGEYISVRFNGWKCAIACLNFHSSLLKIYSRFQNEIKHFSAFYFSTFKAAWH
jgi:hypothetical protein